MQLALHSPPASKHLFELSVMVVILVVEDDDCVDVVFSTKEYFERSLEK
jgi:hypothetical protein